MSLLPSKFLAAILIMVAFVTSAQPSHNNVIYRDIVDPHWFAGADGQTNEFWYSLDLADDRRQFILVNAKQGTRTPAFDHARVAAELSKQTSQHVDGDHLPVEAIQFSKDGQSVVLNGLDASWKLDLQSYALAPVSADDSTENGLPAELIPHRSRFTGPATEVKFVNRLKQPVDLFWIGEDDKRIPYGKLQPGESREQHTYAGHAWLVTGLSGNVIAVFQAERRAGLAIIDGRKETRHRSQAEDQSSPAPTTSPDGNWDVAVHGDNLFLRILKSGEDRQLTYDGNPNSTYVRDVEFERDINMEYNDQNPMAPEPEVYWSPDSRFFVAMRLQPGTERKVYEVQSSPPDQLQPKLTSYPYLKPGDQVPISKPHLFDVENKKEIPVSDTLFANPWSITDVRWNPDSQHFTFLFNQRGHQALRILSVDAQTGAAGPIVDEESKTFIDYSGKYYCDYLDDTREIIWMSERDGWNHLYLYDAVTGQVKNQITKGEWVVRNVDYVDEKKRQIWFQAGGIVPGQNPYYIQECRVNFDGGGLTVLTDGDGTHSAQFSPDRRYLIDTWSRVNLPPVTELRSSDDGHLICKLETADAGGLFASGWKAPEPFVAKGRDGATDIYGVIWRPKNLDPAKKYPIIESIYAGPQDSFTPEDFHANYHEQELADKGFVVVQMDGMGTSNRSKKFHDVCWKNIKDAGFPDRLPWIKAAAAKYPYMDLTRVGIYGTSAGGQDALRGILDYPDFYKVCVADSGCYDNRMDKIWWNEQWMGWPVDDSYARSSCVVDAHKLQGKLMLMVGEMDQNVDPSSTMQVVNALTQADKDFDLVDMPNMGHGVAGTPYGWRRLQEFFVKNLLGAGGDKLDSYNATASN
jgi:dipeptidyl aminopeptidase/acylaminoacyl peptidase